MVISLKSNKQHQLAFFATAYGSGELLCEATFGENPLAIVLVPPS
jgi:hypothetical protein